MKVHIQRFLSLTLCLSMVLGLLVFTAPSASAAGSQYVYQPVQNAVPEKPYLKYSEDTVLEPPGPDDGNGGDPDEA